MAAIGEQALRWFAAGEAEAEGASSVTALVREHSGVLFRVAYSVVRNRAEAEEVVQDVFLRVLQKQTQLAQVEQVRAWLVRIAWNLAIDRRRRGRTAQMDPEFAAALVGRELRADVALDQRQRYESVLRGLDALPKKERQVILLSAMDELGTAEIAEVMGTTESGVRALLFRARARLKERVGREVLG
jgi:RNA polymerase sigma-70 factor (ECF subfamily)